MTRVVKSDSETYVAFAFVAADVLIEADSDGRILFAVGAVVALLGCSARHLEAGGLDDLAILPADRSIFGEARRRMEDGERVRSLPLRMLRDGRAVDVLLSGYVHPDRKTLFMALSAAPAPREPVEKVARDVIVDREAFTVAATSLLRRSDGHYRMTMLDVPEAGTLCESEGSSAYETFISTMGGGLRGLAAGPVGRLGGSRYGVIHGDRVSPDDLTKAVTDAYAEIAPGCAVSASACGTIDLDMADLTDEEAAQALAYTVNLYADATWRGEEDAVSPGAGIGNRLAGAVARMRGLKSAIERGRFGLEFQPVVDLRNDVVHHFECLVRFPGQGDTPYHDVAFAKNSGLITALDRAVMERVVALMRSQLGAHPAIRVSVNQSGKSLSSASYRAWLHQLLGDARDLRGRLMIAITRVSDILDPILANGLVGDFRRAGIQVCLDDFGSGSCVFQTLRTLRVDMAKIDGELVRDCLGRAESAVFIKAMVDVCGGMGVAAMAEQVDNAETLNFLKLMKVRYGQGRYFGEPMSPAGPNAKVAWRMPGMEWRNDLLHFVARGA